LQQLCNKQKVTSY